MDMPYDEETRTVADERKGLRSSTSQNEISHVTANQFRLKVDKPPTSQKMDGHVTTNQVGQKLERQSISNTEYGHVTVNQFERRTDTLSTSLKMNGHLTINQFGLKVETPSTSKKGYDHPGDSKLEQRYVNPSKSRGDLGHVTAGQEGQTKQAPSTPQTRTFKSVVKRHFLKDKLFTLVSDLLGSIEEEKRAQIDLLESFHSAIETTSTVKAYAKHGFTDPIPKDSVKRVSFTPRRRRRQSDASLVDRIFESRRNSVSIAEGTIDNSVQAAKCSNDVVVGYLEIDIRDIHFGEHDRTEKRLNDYCKCGLPKCTPSPHEIININKNYHRANMRPTSDSHESDKDPGFEKCHRSKSLPARSNDKLIVLLQNSFDEDKTEMDHLVLDSILKAADAEDRDTYSNTQSIEDEENECETTKEGDDIENRGNDDPRTVNGEHERTEFVDDEFYDNSEVVVETHRKDSSDISVKCTIHNENPEFENNEDKSYGRAHVVGKIPTSNSYSSLNDSHEHGDNYHEDMNGESKPNNDLERDQKHEPEWYAFSEKLENVGQTQNRSANTDINDTSDTYRRSSKNDVTYDGFGNNREHGHSTISGSRIENTIAIPVESTTEESEEEEIESQIKVVGSSADSHAELDIDSSDNDVSYDKGGFEKDYTDGELEFKQLNDPGGHVSTAEYTTVKRSAASLKPGLDSIAEASHESFRTMSGTPGRDTKSVIEIESKDSQKASRSKVPTTTRQRKAKSPKSRDKDCNANRVKSSRKGSSYAGFNEHSGKTNSGANYTGGKSGKDINMKCSKSTENSRKLISIDLLNFYETNKDLQTIDKKKQTKPQKKAFQRKPEETTSSDSERRHHTRSPSKRRKMIRRKYDMAPLPPKTKPAPLPVLETTFLLPRAKTDLSSRSSRSTSSEDTVESFKNFQVKTIENRYRKPDNIIWNKLEIRRDSNFAINNYADRYGDGHEVVVNGGNGKTLYENGFRVPLRDAIKRVKSAKTVPEYRDVPDRTPRPDRVCRIYIDLQQDRRLAGPMEYRKLDVTPRNEQEHGW